MAARIADRLSRMRRRQFVGRDAELALFRNATLAAELPFCLLYVFGPGGVGKTSLLDAFAAWAEETGAAEVVALDARAVEPNPEAFLGALGQALGGDAAAQTPLLALSARAAARRCVLLVDTYETLEPLDGWIRDSFLPELPENLLVVLSGRQPPAPAWRADGWQTMIHVLPLRNLSPEESRQYLRERSVPAGQHAAVLDFTHGHPLALSLVADVFGQRGDIHFDPDAAPDVIQSLLARFVEKTPGPAHRAALEVCALLRLTTEPLLAHLLEIADGDAVRALFEWLRGLSFMESGRRGVFPHDLAREALLADLRWRSPERYADLHRRAGAYYNARFGETQGEEQQRVLFDFIFLHRDNAVVRGAFSWRESGGITPDALREGDAAALEAMVAKHEGAESARLLRGWLQCQPSHTTVFREAEGAPPVGFGMLIALHEADPEARAADPAAAAAWEYLRRRAPLRPGEAATHFRFWMARDTYQDVSAIQSLILVNHVRQCVTLPGLAFTFFPCADPDAWEPLFAYAEMRRLPEADFSVGDRRFGVFGNDWRALSPTQWLALLADKETAGRQPVAPRRSEPLVVLSREAFAEAVREALRRFCQPDALRRSPLLRSRIVAESVGAEAPSTEKVAALRALVEEVLGSLHASPRRARGARAVEHTYVRPAPTQEQAAERLDLPFSTYRRHLAEGVAHLTEALWQREVGS